VAIVTRNFLLSFIFVTFLFGENGFPPNANLIDQNPG